MQSGQDRGQPALKSVEFRQVEEKSGPKQDRAQSAALAEQTADMGSLFPRFSEKFERIDVAFELGSERAQVSHTRSAWTFLRTMKSIDFGNSRLLACKLE